MIKETVIFAILLLLSICSALPRATDQQQKKSPTVILFQPQIVYPTTVDPQAKSAVVPTKAETQQNHQEPLQPAESAYGSRYGYGNLGYGSNYGYGNLGYLNSGYGSVYARGLGLGWRNQPGVAGGTLRRGYQPYLNNNGGYASSYANGYGSGLGFGGGWKRDRFTLG